MIEVQNVFIIPGKCWNRNRVVESLKGEGYKHNFYIGDLKKPNEFQKHMELADEVWTMGECSDNLMYKYAKEHNLDIWTMG